MIHELKTIPPFFDDVISGERSFEVRKADRPFHKGDFLALNEFNPETKAYTGRSCLVYIDYILRDPEYVKPGFVILGIKPGAGTRRDESIFVNTNIYKVPLVTEADDERN